MAKSYKSKIKKSVKNNPILFLVFVIVFAVCGVGGYFFSNHMIGNDKFEILGEKTINLTLGERYEDEGAIAISFGKDITDKIQTENTIDFERPGQYYIKYSVDDIRYNGVYRYRTIVISEVADE